MDNRSPYKTAAELKIEQWEHDGLAALVGPLSRGELPVDMMCGTAACIGGYVCTCADKRHGTNESSGYATPGFAYSGYFSDALVPLYYPDKEFVVPLHPAWRCSALQAARAIVNFLTLGDPMWSSVMATSA